MTADLRRIGEKAEHIEQHGLPGGPACGDGQRPLDLGLQHVAQQIVDVFVMVIKGIARQPAVLDDIADGDLVQRLDGQKRPERLGDGALGDLLLHPDSPFHAARLRAAAADLGQHRIIPLRPSPDIFRRYCSSKSLKYCAAVGGLAALRMRHAPCGYTKYSCAFQTLYQQKISRRMLLLNCAVLPLAFDSIQCST